MCLTRRSAYLGDSPEDSAGYNPVAKVPSGAPSLALSFEIVLSQRLATQMLAPSETIPRGQRPTGNVFKVQGIWPSLALLVWAGGSRGKLIQPKGCGDDKGEDERRSVKFFMDLETDSRALLLPGCRSNSQEIASAARQALSLGFDSDTRRRARGVSVSPESVALEPRIINLRAQP
jgi:hypothetical protein